MAFDLGTTTVVATLLDVETGTPVAVASMLNKQQPFGGDVITRISATMIDPEALGRLQEAAAATLRELAAAGVRGGRGGPGARLRGGARGQRHDDRPGSRHRPRAARGGAVRDDDSDCRRRCWRRELGLAVHPGRGPRSSPRSVRTSAATSSRGCSPPAWTGTSAPGSSSTSAPTARSCSPTATRIVSHRGAGRAGVRGRRDPVRHARGGRRDRGREAGDPTTVELGVIGDVEPRGPVRLGSGRRGRRAGAGRAARRLGAVRAGRRWPPRSCRRWPTGSRGSARSGCSCCTARTRRPSLGDRRTCRSATSASCSSPRPRSPPAGPCCSRSSASSTRRAAGAARRVVRLLPLPRRPRSGSGWCRSCRCCASSLLATSPARGRRWPCCRCASAPAPRRCWRRWTYVELSDRTDFNDRFVEQLGLLSRTRA